MCDRLMDHLRPLEVEGRAELWRDLNIPAGERWSKEIQDNLNSADIILLLVSANFLGSEYCYEKELSIAIEREHNGEAIVIPISVGQVDWEGLPFSYLNALPQNRTPIRGSGDEDGLLTNVVRGIKHHVKVCSLNNVKEILEQLQLDASLRAIHSYLNIMRTLCDTDTYPIEVYELFTQAVCASKPDFRQSVSLKEVFCRAANGRYFEECLIDAYGAEHLSKTKEVFHGFYQKELATPSQLPEAPTLVSQSIDIDVHVVLLAMTRAEADELVDESAFAAAQPTRLRANNFSQFRQHLEDVFPEWREHYRDRPELWHPLGTSLSEPTDLDSLVTTALDIAEHELSQAYAREISLVRNYQDVRSLHHSNNREFLEELRQDECLIIIDAVSLYHPDIFRAFQRSLLDVYHNTSVVTYAPNEHLLRAMRDMIVALEFPIKDMGFIYRQNPDAADRDRCVVTSEDPTFRRWLNSQMRQAIEDKSFRNIDPPNIRKHFYNTNR